MATINVNNQPAPYFSGTGYGNRTALQMQVRTAANGSIIGADTAIPIGNGDKVRIGRIDAGFTIHDSLAIVSTAFTAGVVAKIGFEYADGIDSTTVPQDDDYFYAALAVNAAGRTRANNLTVAPVTLPKTAWVIATFTGAANAKVAALDLLIEGVDRGPL
jgi:hypothetical protein